MCQSHLIFICLSLLILLCILPQHTLTISNKMSYRHSNRVAQPVTLATGCTNNTDSELAKSTATGKSTVLDTIFTVILSVSAIYLANYMAKIITPKSLYQLKCDQLRVLMNKEKIFVDIDLWEEINSSKQGSKPLTWRAKHELLVRYRKINQDDAVLVSKLTILELAELCYSNVFELNNQTNSRSMSQKKHTK